MSTPYKITTAVLSVTFLIAVDSSRIPFFVSILLPFNGGTLLSTPLSSFSFVNLWNQHVSVRIGLSFWTSAGSFLEQHFSIRNRNSWNRMPVH